MHCQTSTEPPPPRPGKHMAPLKNMRDADYHVTQQSPAFPSPSLSVSLSLYLCVSLSMVVPCVQALYMFIFNFEYVHLQYIPYIYCFDAPVSPWQIPTDDCGNWDDVWTTRPTKHINVLFFGLIHSNIYFHFLKSEHRGQ